jgi:hypothetical protein
MSGVRPHNHRSFDNAGRMVPPIIGPAPLDLKSGVDRARAWSPCDRASVIASRNACSADASSEGARCTSPAWMRVHTSSGNRLRFCSTRVSARSRRPACWRPARRGLARDQSHRFRIQSISHAARRSAHADRFYEVGPAVKSRVRTLTAEACVTNTGECARVKRPNKFTPVNSWDRGA